jgi:hypothetical protein
LHSRAPGAPRDAVLFMTGGPGLSSTSNVPTSRDVIFTEDRDYVVLAMLLSSDQPTGSVLKFCRKAELTSTG